MRAMLIDCENVILREIGMKELKQRDIAQTYRLAMDSDEATRIDWGKVNRAIMERWSKSGLIRIKEMAHSGKCFKSDVDDRKRYVCTVCGENPVDAENGFDTCPTCQSKA